MNTEQQRLLLNFAADIISLAAVIWSLRRFKFLTVKVAFSVCALLLFIFSVVDWAAFTQGGLFQKQMELLQALSPTLRAAPGILAVVMVEARKRLKHL